MPCTRSNRRRARRRLGSVLASLAEPSPLVRHSVTAWNDSHTAPLSSPHTQQTTHCSAIRRPAPSPAGRCFHTHTAHSSCRSTQLDRRPGHSAAQCAFAASQLRGATASPAVASTRLQLKQNHSYRQAEPWLRVDSSHCSCNYQQLYSDHSRLHSEWTVRQKASGSSLTSRRRVRSAQC